MKIPKNLEQRLTTLAILVGFGGLFYAFGGYELRLHSTPEERIQAEQFIGEFKETLKENIAREQRRDSITEIFVDGMKLMDTFRVEVKEVQFKNAVTNYQTKQVIDTMKKYWDDYLNEKNNPRPKASVISNE